MKIIYMGTPAFACPPLKKLAESNHEIAAVVTNPDRPSGRGRKMQSSEVAQLVEQLNLNLLKPSSLKDDNLFEQLKELKPDLIVVIAFQILPKKLFTLPNLGAINIHASLLPKYRGAAPINWALVNGEKETGLSAFYLQTKVDTGDIINQVKIDIDSKDNYDSLYGRLSETAASFLLETIDLIDSKQAQPIIQDHALASQAPKVTPFDALIDFGFPAENVSNFVRGMSSKPGAFTFFRKKKLKILACQPTQEETSETTRPGTIIQNRKKLIVQCANSSVEINRLVPDGKKAMDGLSFINGFKPEVGELMGELPEESDLTK